MLIRTRQPQVSEALRLGYATGIKEAAVIVLRELEEARSLAAGAEDPSDFLVLLDQIQDTLMDHDFTTFD